MSLEPVQPAIVAVARKGRVKSWAGTGIKIAIAVVGIWFVARMLTWNDAGILPANGQPLREVTFVTNTPVTVLREAKLPPVGRGRIATQPRETVEIEFPTFPVKVRIDDHLYSLVIDEKTRIPGSSELLPLSHRMVIPLDALKPINGERVQEGLHSILLKASSRWYLLMLALGLLIIPFIVSAFRWRGLLRPLGISLPFFKCLQLTFVGQFYSTMLPGTTSGDLVKIIYTARLTGSKTKSLITVLLDRVIGLISLMFIAATSAGIQLLWNHHEGAAMDATLVRVFVLIVVLLLGLGTGAFVYFSHRLRRLVGIEWFIENFRSTTNPETAHLQHDKLEMLFRAFNLLCLTVAVIVGTTAAILRWETHLAWAHEHAVMLLVITIAAATMALAALLGLILHEKVVDRLMPVLVRGVGAVIGLDEVLHTYRSHFGLLFWAFLISIPSQLTLPVSAWLSGLALGMNANIGYYLAYVPVAVLATSIPISPPQGIGVLDSVIVHFFAGRGTATATQAFALAQAVRFLPNFWNALGGYWVVTGSYSRREPAAEIANVVEDV